MDELEVGLILGFINEKNNQFLEAQKQKENDDVIEGTAEMLLKM